MIDKESLDNIRIMKFGGKSLATPQHVIRVAEYIRDKIKEGWKIVVVVSAMGDETNELLRLAKEIYGGIPSLRELDKLLVTGEMKTASLMVFACQSFGINAVSLSGFQIRLETNESYGKAKIKRVQNVERIRNLLNQGKVVVIPGFQGVIAGTDEFVTLGRGGSDLTGGAIAGALGTGYFEKYTDTDGVYVIDPRVIPEAKKYKQISYAHLYALAEAGAEVFSTRGTRLVEALQVKVKILLSPSIGQSDGGTLVYSGGTLSNMEDFELQSGVAIKKGISMITISDIANKPGEADKIFELISNINIIDSVQGQGKEKANISIIFKNEDLNRVLSGLEKLDGDEIVGEPTEVAELTLINPRMNEESGWMYRVTHAMHKARVNIEMLSTVGDRIMIVVKKESLKEAAMGLAEEFNLLN